MFKLSILSSKEVRSRYAGRLAYTNMAALAEESLRKGYKIVSLQYDGLRSDSAERWLSKIKTSLERHFAEKQYEIVGFVDLSEVDDFDKLYFSICQKKELAHTIV